MGTYVYTLRKKQRSITLPGGEKVKANYYSYAYKPNWALACNYNTKQSENAYGRAAEAAYDAYDGGLVIVADPDDKDLNGRHVYRNVQSPVWYDSYDFPGEAVGFIKQEGRKLTVVSEHRWRAQQPDDRTFIEYVEDGKFKSGFILDIGVVE